MQILTLPAFRVHGVQARTSNDDEQTLKTARLPLLWHDVHTELVPLLPEDAPIYGVYSDYESDQHGYYTVTAGCDQAVSNVKLPMTAIDVPEGRYLVFSAKGKMPETVIRTWLQVWDYFDSPQAGHVRSFTKDFEVYRGREENSVQVSIYIAIR